MSVGRADPSTDLGRHPQNPRYDAPSAPPLPAHTGGEKRKVSASPARAAELGRTVPSPPRVTTYTSAGPVPS